MMSQTLALCDHIIGLYGIEMFHFEYSSGKLVSIGLGPDHKSEEDGDVESQVCHAMCAEPLSLNES